MIKTYMERREKLYEVWKKDNAENIDKALHHLFYEQKKLALARLRKEVQDEYQNKARLEKDKKGETKKAYKVLIKKKGSSIEYGLWCDSVADAIKECIDSAEMDKNIIGARVVERETDSIVWENNNPAENKFAFIVWSGEEKPEFASTARNQEEAEKVVSSILKVKRVAKVHVYGPNFVEKIVRG